MNDLFVLTMYMFMKNIKNDVINTEKKMIELMRKTAYIYSVLIFCS